MSAPFLIVEILTSFEIMYTASKNSFIKLNLYYEALAHKNLKANPVSFSEFTQKLFFPLYEILLKLFRVSMWKCIELLLEILKFQFPLVKRIRIKLMSLHLFKLLPCDTAKLSRISFIMDSFYFLFATK